MSSKNQLALLGEIQAIGGKVSLSVGTDLPQRLSLIESNLNQTVDNARESIEATVTQSSAAVSQSVVSEMGRMLPLPGDSVISSVSQQINSSRSLIEAAVRNSTAEVKAALETQMRLQVVAVASLLGGIPEDERGQACLTLEAQKLPFFRYPISPSKGRGSKVVQRMPLGCNCSANVRCTTSCRFHLWGLSKVGEELVMHERSCPLWYLSRRTTKYGVNILLLKRLRIFGSIHISNSPYASIFGWNISQNLTCSAVVSDDAPSFRVLQRYLSDLEPKDYERCIVSCSQDLRAVFQSGLGSPQDRRADGMSLFEVSFKIEHRMVYAESIYQYINL